jgi:hypothetical protein
MGDKSPKNNTKAKKQKADKKGRGSGSQSLPEMKSSVVPRVGRERS